MSELYYTRPHEEQYAKLVKNLSDEELLFNYRLHHQIVMSEFISVSVMSDELSLVYEFIIGEMAERYAKSFVDS